MATCPACAEPIDAGTEICPHCGINVPQYFPGKARAAGGDSGMTLGLIIGGSVLFVMLLLCAGGFAFRTMFMGRSTLTAVQTARESAREAMCRNNLRQIGLALHNYHDMYGSFPPAYIADESGRPMHSWRVLILPQLDQQALYSRYRWDEPWDGPNNSQLLSEMPAIYRCPSHPETNSTNTAYAGVFGPKSMFRGTLGIRLADVTDAPMYTAMVGELTDADIPWMQPRDVDITQHPVLGDSEGFSSYHPDGVHFLFVDGSARLVPEETDEEMIKALYTVSGGEKEIMEF